VDERLPKWRDISLSFDGEENEKLYLCEECRLKQPERDNEIVLEQHKQMPAMKLARCIVPPARLAQVIDWKKSGSVIMSLDINEHRIGLAVANHPTPDNEVHELDPIPYMTRMHPSARRRDENDRIGIELEKLVRGRKVNAFVVGWPLQPDGRPGALCGKVLHVLDFLAERRGPILTKGRPFALWDIRDIPRNRMEEGLINDSQKFSSVDRWGRSSLFCKTPAHDACGYVYKSGSQFCHQSTDDSTAAALILKHFMDTNWKPQDTQTAMHFNESGDDCEFEHAVDQYDNDGFCIETSLL